MMHHQSSEVPLLRLDRISKFYGNIRALSEVDFEARAGEVLALVGDNGAGKSTLAKVIAGVHVPDSGEMFLNGQPYRTESPRDAKQLGIEILPQNLGLLDNLSITANVFLGAEVRRSVLGWQTPFLDKRQMSRRTSELLDQFGLDVGLSSRKVSALSGGQRQLLAIAKTAGFNPRLIVMDEPTAALGVQESERVLDLVRHLKDQGTTVVIISHNLRHVFAIADRVTVLRQGRNAGTVDTAASSQSEVVHYITGAEFGTASESNSAYEPQNGKL